MKLMPNRVHDPGKRSVNRIVMGYVNSLDALPLMAAGREAAKSGDTSWVPVTCQSESNLVRQLSDGTLQGGLVPFDLFATQILSEPVETVSRWRVLAVQPRSSWEFLLTGRANRLISRAGTPGRRTPPVAQEFRIAMSGPRSTIRRGVDLWLRQQQLDSTFVTSYHLLPLKLMHKALESEIVEALVLPAPGGTIAQIRGLGTVVSPVQEMSCDLGMLLVVDRNALNAQRTGVGEEIQALVKESSSHARGRDLSDPSLSTEIRILFEELDARGTNRAIGLSGDLHPMQFEPAADYFSSRLEYLSELGFWNGDDVAAMDVALALTR